MTLTEQLLEFVGDECVEREDLFVAFGSLYDAFQAWAEARGYAPSPKRTVAVELGNLGFAAARTQYGRVRLGIDLKSNDPPAASDEQSDEVTDEQAEQIRALLNAGEDGDVDDPDLTRALRALARKWIIEVAGEGPVTTWSVLGQDGQRTTREKMSSKLEAALRIWRLIEPPPKPDSGGPQMCPACAEKEHAWQAMRDLKLKAASSSS